MSELNITEITLENFSETITKYISDKCIKITDIDSMIETYISMLGDHYLFKFDRDLLKDMLVDITYMYSPNDDANKDRVLSLLVGSDSDSEDEESSMWCVDGTFDMRKQKLWVKEMLPTQMDWNSPLSLSSSQSFGSGAGEFRSLVAILGGIITAPQNGGAW